MADFRSRVQGADGRDKRMDGRSEWMCQRADGRAKRMDGRSGWTGAGGWTGVGTVQAYVSWLSEVLRYISSS